MINMYAFRDIISNWLDQRGLIETTEMTGAAFDIMPDEEKDKSRYFSLLGHLKVVIWQLKQQKKDAELLSHVLESWVYAARRCNLTRQQQADTLYALLEDYLNGQGYPTRRQVPAVRPSDKVQRPTRQGLPLDMPVRLDERDKGEDK